jgi:hypothetical protein
MEATTMTTTAMRRRRRGMRGGGGRAVLAIWRLRGVGEERNEAAE